jgi:glycosyltransferase involved in cell wall biosynthesis
MSKFTAHLPINTVSFGQTSTLFLRTYLENIQEYSKEKDLSGLFLIGQPDLSSQDPAFAQGFMPTLESLVAQGMESHNRSTPCFKLWHLNGSLESFSNGTLLLTFYELDSPTKAEINIAKNNRVAFSSEYTRDIFKSYGVESTYLPLAFDSYNFKQSDKKYADDGRITFTVVGKFEKRKNHAKVIQAWIKKFGNNPKYFLQCAIYNSFLPNHEQQNQAITQHLTGGQKYFNVQFYGHMLQNNVYNDFLNSSDIILGLSGGEGWGLPEFTTTALGKHAVILNAHGYKDWANEQNAVLVNPSGKQEAYDNFFFNKGAPFNQGNIFDFDEDEFIAACETAIKKVEENPVNEAGLKLQQDFSKERFVKTVLKNL